MVGSMAHTYVCTRVTYVYVYDSRREHGKETASLHTCLHNTLIYTPHSYTCIHIICSAIYTHCLVIQSCVYTESKVN